jgi:DNA-binding transcriptional ArsR family regulator
MTRQLRRTTSTDTLDNTLAALAEPTRRRVIDLLRERPRRAGELANAFHASPPAMSRHLRVLRKHGLVEEERGGDPGDSRYRIYRLRREPFNDLHAWLDRVQEFWNEQLGGFKEHAEHTRKAKRT